jgi:hypothetical protein
MTGLFSASKYIVKVEDLQKQLSQVFDQLSRRNACSASNTLCFLIQDIGNESASNGACACSTGSQLLVAKSDSHCLAERDIIIADVLIKERGSANA